MRLLVLCLLAGCTRSLPAGDPSRPDVIVISVDTLRADHLGAYGYARPTSPFLDGLAARGTRFSSAWSPSPWTLPSHATMLSGLLPLHHGAIESELSVPADAPWLPAAFRDAGYATSAAVATLFVSEQYGFDRGFDDFEAFGIDDERTNRKSTVDAADVFGHARTWVSKREPGQPLFLFLHVYDVHYEYDPPSPFDTQFDRANTSDDPAYRTYFHYLKHPLTPEQLEHQVAQYDEEIAYVDDQLRALRAAWDDAGRDAIWVVTADHGEEFGERGSWGHAHTLWPEQLHVPWIVAGPGVKAQVRDERVGTEDLAPTLAALAGIPWTPTDGVARAATLRDGGAAPAHVSAQLAETSRFDTLKVRWHDPPHDLVLDLRSGQATLCDLSADPGCTRDLAETLPDRAAAMRAALEAHVDRSWTATADGTVRTDGVIDVQPRRTTRALTAGERVSVLPLDAEVRFTADGTTAGPWSAVGGVRPPAGAPLTLDAPQATPGSADLDDAQRQQLEALGYLQ